jgi:hypothetical protein
MNGNMIEAKTRHVDWLEVDVNTFARLCEFAYLRDYNPPSPHVTDDQFLDSKTKLKKERKIARRKNLDFTGMSRKWKLHQMNIEIQNLSPRAYPMMTNNYHTEREASGLHTCETPL